MISSFIRHSRISPDEQNLDVLGMLPLFHDIVGDSAREKMLSFSPHLFQSSQEPGMLMRSYPDNYRSSKYGIFLQRNAPDREACRWMVGELRFKILDCLEKNHDSMAACADGKRPSSSDVGIDPMVEIPRSLALSLIVRHGWRSYTFHMSMNNLLHIFYECMLF